jgi:hypothetical protein
MAATYATNRRVMPALEPGCHERRPDRCSILLTSEDLIETRLMLRFNNVSHSGKTWINIRQAG